MRDPVLKAVCLAILSAAGAASAQTTVTMFGVADAAYSHASGTNTVSRLVASGYNSSRLGFRGIEDMGGGVNAGFWLEAGLASDSGQGLASNSNNQTTGAGANVAGRQGLIFDRRSTVSIGGSWGELRLGRDYTPQFWSLAVYDPWGANGIGMSQIANSSINNLPPATTGARASNAIAYLYGHAFNSTYVGGAGFHAAVMYYMGENVSGAANSNDGNGWGVRLGYGAGPMSLALATSKTTYAVGDVHQTNIGADYNFGPAVLQGLYESDKNGAVTGKGWLIGTLVPVGVGQVRASYSTYKTETATSPKTNKYSVGYVHNLSKRTAVYVDYAHTSNSGGAAGGVYFPSPVTVAANGSGSGYAIGVRHAF